MAANLKPKPRKHQFARRPVRTAIVKENNIHFSED